MFKRFLSLTALLALVACTDTTGLSAESSKTFHPDSNSNAAVTVLEFGDLQCPACRSAQDLVVGPLLAQYGSQIRFEFRQFPLASIHRYALEAAEASECAADQGKFWEFVELNYTEQDRLSESGILEEWGKKIGLDMTLYSRCRASDIKRDMVIAEYEAGRKLGVGGTPTFFVNGQQVESTISALGEAITKAAGTAGQLL